MFFRLLVCPNPAILIRFRFITISWFSFRDGHFSVTATARDG